MTGDLEILLDGIPVLRDLPPASLEELGEAITRRSVAPGEYLFRQGEGPPPSVYYLVSATAEILAGPPYEEWAVSLSRPGQLVGWLTVFTDDPFPASARIVEPGALIQIPADVVRRLLDRHPAVGRVLAVAMAQRVEDLFQEIRAEATHPPLSPAETFPFRKKVSEVMTSPVLTLPSSESARGAAQTMRKIGTSSVVVSDGGHPLGIVTEKDLAHRVLAEGRDPDTTLLKEVMTRPVNSLAPDAYLYKALGAMRRNRVRHLPVVDGDRLVGMLSMRALMAMGTSDTLELVEQIASAGNADVLAEVHQKSRLLCGNLLTEGMPAEEVSQLMSHINRDLHRRVLEIAIDELKAAGRTRPTVPFCFVVSMILADYPPESWHEVEPYFMDLSGRVSEGLARVGFTLCRGNVMSSNPVWRKPMREWKAQVLGWYANPSSNAVRYSTLFYDFLPIWGDASLARELRSFITKGIQRNFQLLRCLFDEASHHKVPLTFFKSFITEKSGPHRGQMDVKRSGLLFVVECARILALRHGVAATGTVERLQALAQNKAVPADEAEFVQTAYKTLVHFLLTAQVRKLRTGEATDNYIDPQTLSIQERYLLRHALEATGRLQGMVHASFGNLFF
jgi:CBS domain-containing protein